MPSMQSGAIDAAEWVGPWNDLAFGLYQVAKFYYTPAFHEPGPGLEIFVGKDKFDALSPDLQAIIRYAAQAISENTLADFTFNNLQPLRSSSELISLLNQPPACMPELPA